MLTRLARWDPDLDTSAAGPVAHDYFEEVLILSDSLHDLGLQQTFGAWLLTLPPARHGSRTMDHG
jgi:hypothetical protein